MKYLWIGLVLAPLGVVALLGELGEGAKMIGIIIFGCIVGDWAYLRDTKSPPKINQRNH